MDPNSRNSDGGGGGGAVTNSSGKNKKNNEQSGGKSSSKKGPKQRKFKFNKSNQANKRYWTSYVSNTDRTRSIFPSSPSVSLSASSTSTSSSSTKNNSLNNFVQHLSTNVNKVRPGKRSYKGSKRKLFANIKTESKIEPLLLKRCSNDTIVNDSFERVRPACSFEKTAIQQRIITTIPDIPCDIGESMLLSSSYPITASYASPNRAAENSSSESLLPSIRTNVCSTESLVKTSNKMSSNESIEKFSTPRQSISLFSMKSISSPSSPMLPLMYQFYPFKSSPKAQPSCPPSSSDYNFKNSASNSFMPSSSSSSMSPSSPKSESSKICRINFPFSGKKTDRKVKSKNSISAKQVNIDCKSMASKEDSFVSLNDEKSLSQTKSKLISPTNSTLKESSLSKEKSRKPQNTKSSSNSGRRKSPVRRRRKELRKSCKSNLSNLSHQSSTFYATSSSIDRYTNSRWINKSLVVAREEEMDLYMREQYNAIRFDHNSSSMVRGRVFFGDKLLNNSTRNTHYQSWLHDEDDDHDDSDTYSDEIRYDVNALRRYLQGRQKIANKVNTFNLKKSKLLPNNTLIKNISSSGFNEISTKAAPSTTNTSSTAKIDDQRLLEKSKTTGICRTYSRLSIDSQKTIYMSKLIHKSLTFCANSSNTSISNLPFDRMTMMKDGGTIKRAGPEDVITPCEVLVRGYVFLRKVVQSPFSTLFEANRISNPHRKLACKHIRASAMVANQEFMKGFLRQEICIFSQVAHPNIIELYEIVQLQTDVFIFMKFAINGTIFDYLYKFWLKPLPETYAKRWMKQLISALEYIHNRKIVHRDLKLDNFLLDEKYTALLSDFGMAVSLTSSQANELLAIHCGTSDYMAPEVHMASNCSNSYYDPFPSDIYSMGVCLFEMVNYYRPFAMSVSESHRSLIYRQKNRKYDFNNRIYLTKECHELLYQLLEPKPHLRPKASQILEHIWFHQSIR